MNHSTRNQVKTVLLTILLLAAAAQAQVPMGKSQAGQMTPQAATNPVVGGGTIGRLSRWSGVTGNTFVLGDSSIFEDKFGKVGVGTDAPTSKLTVAGMIESVVDGVKFPDGTVQTTAFNANQVVRSLNGLQGDLTLAAGTNITVTPSGGKTLTIAAPNALTAVAHNATLTGNGTQASPLGVADGGIGTVQLADNAVTAAKIAPTSVVKSFNGLKDDITLAAGANISLTPVGNTLTIASTAADPDQNLFQQAYETTVGTDQDNFVSHVTIPVPSGKRLVIDFLSLSVEGDGDMQLMIVHTHMNGVESKYYMQLPKDNSGLDGVAIEKQVRILSDSDIVLGLVNHNGSGKIIRVTVSGHLLDLP